MTSPIPLDEVVELDDDRRGSEEARLQQRPLAPVAVHHHQRARLASKSTVAGDRRIRRSTPLAAATRASSSSLAGVAVERVHGGARAERARPTA